jgi:CBS-domain-containing membrane protein
MASVQETGGSGGSADEIELADEDILDAMRHTHGYVDISTEDFRALYHLAYRHGHTRLHERIKPVLASRAHTHRREAPPRVELSEILWSTVGAMIGMGLLAAADGWLFRGTDLVLMIGSFGASVTMLFGIPRSPLTQPRNLVGGHVVSALVGVLAYQLLHDVPWLAAAVAVGGAVALMHATRLLHPPGGGTALIAVTGSAQVHAMGYLYVLVPAVLGPLLLLAVALVMNNVPRSRSYPEFW